MIPQAIQNEIYNHKAQLDSFLASKFIDQSLILGFTAVIQSKFHQWILADVSEFRQLFVEAGDIKQIDTSLCSLIDYLRILWSDFHHPIVKLYQKQHAELYGLLIQSLKTDKKKFKSVEMRKLNELFEKYVKAVKVFYTSVMSDLGTRYPNPLVPQKYLQEFGIVIPAAKDELLYEAFHSTLSYITFLCLVGLGNVSRSSAQIRISFVQPCQSIHAHYKHLQKSNVDKSEGKSFYIFPLLCYSKCIGLLPTMHEPYNHIGVIYNSLGQKFSAILWFLRSQFTRDLSFAVGKRNLVSAFTKPWLEEAYDQAIRKDSKLVEPVDANNILLRIVAEYFFPSAFRKRLYAEKAESDFLDILFSEPYCGRFVKNTSVITEHLTVFICFYELAVQSQEPVKRDKFGAFVCRYITAYLNTLKSQSFLLSDAEMPLKNIRLILAFLRKSPIVQSCGPRFLQSLVDAFNSLKEFDGEEVKRKIIDAFVEGKAPIRSHYFSEDIHFKDFTPIGCQFKDFDDSHLFLSGNVHLLFGSSFYEDDRGMTDLLDNEAVLRINKEVELASGDNSYREKVVASECLRSENILRSQASVVLAGKIFGTRIHLDSEKEHFEIEKLHVPKTQQRNAEPARRKNTKAKQSDRMKPQTKFEFSKSTLKHATPPAVSGQTVQSPPAQAPPLSMGEIELMILGHAPKLMSKRQDQDADVGLADMVSAIVSEDETRESSMSVGDGAHDVSNDAISKSTESSRIDSQHYMDNARFGCSPNGQGLPQPGPQLARLDDSSQAASFDRSAYQNQMGYQPNYQTPQKPPIGQTPFMQHYPQYYMGYNAGQLPPMAQFGGNAPPINGYPSVPIPQPNGTFFPGVPPFLPSQPITLTPGNSHGMFAPQYMLAQYPPTIPAQDNQKNGKPFPPNGYSMYPQYQ